MDLRKLIRRHRLYRRSAPVFEAALVDPSVVRWLPWRSGSGSVRVAFRSGRSVDLPTRHWDLLPNLCRLDLIGASIEVLAEHKRVCLGDVVLHSPHWTRAEPGYYREVFIDDAYGTRLADRSGQIVVDVGAYVGDSAVAFARSGATVHAVEPLQTLARCIDLNAQANGLRDRIVTHPVGLDDRAVDLEVEGGPLCLVAGVDYALTHLPARIDLLKIDCEGAEYGLFADARFLDHLAPREIRMEYHRGPEPLVSGLRARGYSVRYDPSAEPVGLLTATRSMTD
jgi:hypothetical protein